MGDDGESEIDIISTTMYRTLGRCEDDVSLSRPSKMD